MLVEKERKECGKNESCTKKGKEGKNDQRKEKEVKKEKKE